MNNPWPEKSIPLLSKNANELIEDLLLFIQYMASGTATIYNNILPENLLQFKIHISANSPIVILQYAIDTCYKNGFIQSYPILDYKEMCEISDKYSCENGDDYKEELDPLVKQEIPEVLAAQNNVEEKEELQKQQLILTSNLRENQGIENFLQIYISVDSGSNSIVASSANENISLKDKFYESPSLVVGRNFETAELNPNFKNISLGDIKRNLKNKINSCQEQICLNEKSLSCRYCEKTFKTLNDLMRHERIHTGEKPFGCSYCRKVFTRKDQKLAHERTHSGLKPHSCAYCGKSFALKHTVKIHERIHTGEKPFSCMNCSKCFITKQHLQIHERIHTGERPYLCSYCGKSFGKKTNLQQHERIHIGKEPYSCRYSGKLFRKSQRREDHEMSHIREKPCGKSCTDNHEDRRERLNKWRREIQYDDHFSQIPFDPGSTVES